MSLRSYSISFQGGTQGHRDTTQIRCSICFSIHTQSLFEVGHRDTGTQLQSVILFVFPFILNLFSRWDTGTQGHNSNQLYCLSFHSYSISIRGRKQGHRDTTQISYSDCLSLHTQSLFEVGHRNTGTQLESLILYVSPFILNLYSRWDTGTQGHNLNHLYCLSLHLTQSLFEVGHRDTGTQLESVILTVSPFIYHLYSRWDAGTQGHTSNPLFCLSLHPYSISIRGGTQLESVILFVSPFILNLYLRWDTGTQGHNSNQLFLLSLHSYLISIRGGTQGHGDTT
jgi:hypothetical protein